MKKLLLIMLTFMASFSVYAQEVKTEQENEVATANYPTNVYWSTVTINYDTMTVPVEIVVNAPNGNILCISGPSNPNIQTWRVANGKLYITLNEREVGNIIKGEITYIEIATTTAGYYIELNVI